MGTSSDKHARQKANRAAAQAAAGPTRGRGPLIAGLVVVLLVLVGLVVFFVGGEDDGDDETGGSTTTAAPADGEDTTTSAPADGEAAALPAPPEGITLSTDTPCPPAGGTEKRVQVFAGPPPMCIDPAATYTATFSTTEGDFTATLDAATAPATVNNFVVLARYHYYDGVPFHRIVPGFVIQAGDGDGEPWGSNDLGYTIADELPADPSAYTDYSLAMANSGPSTNGSQFFVVLPGGGAQLQALYSWFGQVTEGTEVVDTIASYGGADQSPTKAVLINTVTITETPA